MSLYKNKNKNMSDVLEQVFKKQKTLEQLEEELRAISESIDPQFSVQFETYRIGLL
ncbi:hypothetical protein LDC_2523 [sediment metagenome]|uniref:Uncharacterized protein n=1 Tax=sediment metagenome TaxID=749907 RepID=D9PLU7_9ZZZZ